MSEPEKRVQAWAAWHPEKGFGRTPHACWDIDDAINDAKCAAILDDSPLWKAVRVEIIKLEPSAEKKPVGWMGDIGGNPFGPFDR